MEIAFVLKMFTTLVLMNNLHNFEASLSWEKKQLQQNGDRINKSKNHIIQAVSAAKSFKGDPALYNPEDLLLSSLVSCHMMSYLYLCAQHKIEILSYSDQAKAILETYSNGSGKIIEVILNPIILLNDASQINQAISLHTDANKLCFIANSCNFPVKHKAKCLIYE